MAEEKVTTNIVVNSNFSDLVTDLNKATAALTNFRDKLSVSNKQLASSIAVMNRTFAETMRSTGQFSTHFVSLNTDVEKFGSQLDKGQIKLKQFFRTFNDHTKTSGGLIRQLAQQQVQLQNSILQPLGRNAEGIMQYNVHIPRGLDLVKNKTALAKQELQILNRVMQEGANQLINWGKNTQWAGRQLTVGLTVPIAAFGKAAADAFKVADQELTRLTKVYGGVAATSTAELKRIRNEVSATAADLAKAYGASFQDTIGLAADIAATGKQGNELLGSVRETTRLAVLGEVDRQEAMKATLAIQTAFKQNTNELAESINFLNAVENQTSTTLQDLVEAIPKAGPIIKGLGGSVQDLALYLTAMREGGVSASEGANALKSALGSLINPTKVATGMFAGFGIDLKDIVAKNAGNVTATILELQAALDKLDPLQKQQALEQLFGKFQFARMNALFSNLGKQGSQTLQVLDLMKASSQDLANIAGRELTQVTESASGRYRRALEGLKADLAGVGDQFLAINTTLINVIDRIIGFANNLPKPIKQLLSVLGMFTAAAGPIIMLTGVLGNFIGFLVKGMFHLKALFKGGEGWKLLTPEILAANRAASVTEEIFYSDAKAASVFRQAVQGLTGSLAVLETQLNSGVLNIAPQMNAAASGLRVVNPTHPMVSAVDTRSMSHMNPFSKMSQAEKEAQTIFGVVPGAPKVNQRISANPQIYATGDLPPVTGLTQIRGVSTGVVAGEAAKWHSMTAAIAMQSKAELDKLKIEVMRTGLVTDEVSTAYEAIFPKMNELVNNAAEQSALIVQSAKAGKISVDQARAQIVALNAQLEQMMAQTATQTAAGLGRTINLQQVPLTQQPLLGQNNKVNLKEMTRPGRTRELLNKIAGALGVRTYGAGYSIETTKPKKMNTGGDVFYNNGDQVPGPNVNVDMVPAMLTPGEFVIRRGVAQQDPEGMRALNAGRAMIVPFNMGGKVPGVQYKNLGGVLAFLKTMRGAQRPMVAKSLIDRIWPGRLTDRAKADYYEPKGNVGSFGGAFIDKLGNKVTTSAVNKQMEGIGVDPRTLLASINTRGGGSRLSTDVFLDGLASAGIISKSQKRNLSRKVFNEYARQILGMSSINDRNNPIWSVSNRVLNRELSSNESALNFWNEYSRMPGSFAHPKRRSSTGFLNEITINGQTVKFANLEASGKNKFYHAKESSNPFISTIDQLVATGGSFLSRNKGGVIPGYAGGGGVLSKAGVLKKLGAMFSVNEGGRGYTVNALPRYVNTKAFDMLPISLKAKKFLYGALVDDITNRSPKSTGSVPYGPITAFGRMSKTIRGFGGKDRYDIWQNVSGLLKNNPNLSEQDRAFFAKVNSNSQEMPGFVARGLGLNRGGMVPGRVARGYIGGGKVLPLLASAALSSLGYMGGAAIGRTVAGTPGEFIGGMLGGSLGGAGMMSRKQLDPTTELLKVDRAYGRSAIPVTKWKNSLAEAALSGNRLTSTVSKLALGISRTNLIMAAGVTAAVALYKAYDNARKAREASQDAIKIDEKGAQQLGITYKSAINNVKETTKAIIEQRKLLEAKAAGASSVGGGVNLTVSQLKELQKQVKQTSPDIIEMFNNLNRNDVVKNVADLKAQLVASGVSAKDATNKIYALMSLSNKSDMTTAALGSADFNAIIDQKSAAQYGTKTLGKALTNKTDIKELVNTLDQSLVSIDAYYNSISKVKDKTGKLVIDNKAVAQTINEIKNSEGGRVKLGQQNLQNILAQKPELNNVLSASDSIADAWVKIRLYTSGITGDLSKISGSQAQGMLQVVESIKASATALTSSDTSAKNPFLKLVKAGNAAAAAAKAADLASKNASTNAQKNADAEAKKIENKIKKINEEYDARRRLIELQTSKESFQIQLQKEQLNYQQALASGNMSAAAQSQLNLKQMNIEYQKTMALDALQEKNKQDNKKADEEKARIQDKLNKAQEQANKLAKAAAEAQQKASSIAIIQQSIANTLVAAAVTTDQKQLSKLSKSFESDVKELSKLAPDAAKALTPENKTDTWGIVAGKRVPVAPGADWEGKLMGLSGKGSKLIDDSTKQALDNFGIALNKFNEFWGRLLKLPKVKDEATKALARPHGKGYAKGGLLSGPGTGTSDSIFMPMLPAGKYAMGAYLSTGEYVVNANAVSKKGVLDLLNTINYDPSFNMPKAPAGNSAIQMGTSVFNIAPVINAAPHMDEYMIADIASKKVIDMIKQQQGMSMKSVGGSKVVGNKWQ